MKYWVFDLDGTLVDSFGPYFKILEGLLEKTLSAAEKKEFIGLHPEKILGDRLSLEQTKVALEILNEKSKTDASCINAFDAIPALLQRLTGKGKRLSVWTARDLNSAKLILENLNLNQYIDCIISGDCVALRKPHPEGLIKIQNFYDCSAHEMVMVGDHEHDMEAGQSAGVFTVRASWHQHWNDGSCRVGDKQFICDQEFFHWALGQ